MNNYINQSSIVIDEKFIKVPYIVVRLNINNNIVFNESFFVEDNWLTSLREQLTNKSMLGNYYKTLTISVSIYNVEYNKSLSATIIIDDKELNFLHIDACIKKLFKYMRNKDAKV